MALPRSTAVWNVRGQRISARRWWALVPLAVLAACGESHEPRDPLPITSFCGSFFDALCEPLEDCACGADVVLACREEQATLCRDDGLLSPALVDAITAGRLRYDGSAAAALVTRMRDRARECQAFVEALEWRVRDLYSLGEVFVGTSPPGAACQPLGFELLNTCELGTCSPDGRGEHHCRPVANRGEPCGSGTSCVDLDARLTSVLGLDRLMLRCVEMEGELRCASRVALSELCGSTEDCAEGACEEDRCVFRPLGGECTRSRQCESGYCAPSTGRCAEGGAVLDERCDAHGACESGTCLLGRCRPRGCHTF